jgi:hypothetical protein
MIAFSRHYLIRLKAVFTEPYAFSVFLLTGAASLMHWPGLIDTSRVIAPMFGTDSGMNEAALMLLWVFVWPMLAGGAAGGSVAGGGRDAMALRPLPALPVSMRTRVLAEAALIFTFVLIFRIPAVLLGESFYQTLYLPGLLDAREKAMDAFIDRSLLGSLMMLPAVLIWTAPSRNAQVYFLVRPVILILAMVAAMCLGLYATAPLCVLTSVVLSAIVLWGIGREFSMPHFFDSGIEPAHRRWRPALHPHKRLRRDFWVRPLPVLCLLLLLEIVLMAIERAVGLGEWGLYMGSCFVYGFAFSLVALRPMGLYFVETALSGRTGSPRGGDVGRAWITLPVRREAMTRAVYLHGLITGTLIWLLIMLAGCMFTYFRTGEFALKDSDGDSMLKFFLPFCALVLCLAGGLTNMAVGDMTRALISLGTAVAILFGHIGLLIAKASTLEKACVLGFLALLGGAPALVHLRANRDVDDSKAPIPLEPDQGA